MKTTCMSKSQDESRHVFDGMTTDRTAMCLSIQCRTHKMIGCGWCHGDASVERTTCCTRWCHHCHQCHVDVSVELKCWGTKDEIMIFAALFNGSYPKIEYSRPWKVLPKSWFHLLFLLPKSSFGEHKLQSHKMMIVWWCGHPTQKTMIACRWSWWLGQTPTQPC